MGQINFPKQSKPKQVNFSGTKQSQNNTHIGNKAESDLLLEIDELKTSKNRIDAQNQAQNEEIAQKQNTLQFDDAPTQGSSKPVKSDGVFSALSSKQDTLSAGTGISISNNTVSVDTNTVATKTDLASKQDALTAGNNISISGGTISATDTTYTAGSNISIDQSNQIH